MSLSVQHVRCVIWTVHVFCVCCMCVSCVQACMYCTVFCAVDVCSVPQVLEVQCIVLQYTPWQQMSWHGAQKKIAGLAAAACKAVARSHREMS